LCSKKKPKWIQTGNEFAQNANRENETKMNDNMTKIGKMAVMTGLLLCCTLAGAQPRTLTLADCREMAVAQSKELDQARIQTEMAGYDRKIALANYFPKVTAAGSYVYNTGTSTSSARNRAPALHRPAPRWTMLSGMP